VQNVASVMEAAIASQYIEGVIRGRNRLSVKTAADVMEIAMT